MLQYEEHYGSNLIPDPVKLVYVRRFGQGEELAIPADMTCQFYVEYLAWKAAGGVPTIVNDYVPPQEPQKDNTDKKLDNLVETLRAKGII